MLDTSNGCNNTCKVASGDVKLYKKVLRKIAKRKASKKTNKSATSTTTLQYKRFVNGLLNTYE